MFVSRPLSRLAMGSAASLMFYLIATSTALAQAPTSVPVPVPASLPPVASFFANNAFSGAILSPDGDYLAVRISWSKRRDVLAIIDLQTRSAKVVAEYGDSDIGNFQWVNNNRLVYDLRDSTRASGEVDRGPGLYAINRDGSAQIKLASLSGYEKMQAPQPWNTFLMDDPGSQDSDWIYVLRPEYDGANEYTGTRLRQLNTLTGKSKLTSEPDVEVSDFMLDFNGEPRLATLFSDSYSTIYYRDPATDKWRELASELRQRQRQDQASGIRSRRDFICGGERRRKCGNATHI